MLTDTVLPIVITFTFAYIFGLLIKKYGLSGLFNMLSQLIERIIDGPPTKPEPEVVPKSCKIEHIIALRETEIYGVILSASVHAHVVECDKYPEVFQILQEAKTVKKPYRCTDDGNEHDYSEPEVTIGGGVQGWVCYKCGDYKPAQPTREKSA